ncbi:hypothetical protein QC763_403875 [Podospora pseudopauciseta]|nr:hypothetical protein QC763_403875 [Podospora pseudopauciseta]KAK4676838.1 hypothetical protein QC764_403875 [Podospora pseudoanserina]
MEVLMSVTDLSVCIRSSASLLNQLFLDTNNAPQNTPSLQFLQDSQSFHHNSYNNHQTFNMSDRAAQSPPPEEQSGRQLNDPPASGKGTDDASNKEQTNKSGLENLSSNPKGPMDDEVTKKFAKNTKMGESQ